MDTRPFASEEKELLQRYGFPSHGIYSRGVAEKDQVTSMGMPFYRYRVFKTHSYILTRRKHSAERERPVGEEERIDSADSLEELLRSNERLLESKKTKGNMKLSESKLRSIIREELLKEVGGPYRDRPRKALMRADYFEVFHDAAAAMGQPSLETTSVDEVIEFLRSKRNPDSFSVVINGDNQMLASVPAPEFLQTVNAR